MKYLILTITMLLASISMVFMVSTAQISATNNKCGGVDTSIINCDDPSKPYDPKNPPTDVKESAIWKVLKMVINIMTGGVVILAVGGLVYASILYTSSGGNPETRKKSISIIINIVIGIVAYALMWAILNFILPGGIGL